MKKICFILGTRPEITKLYSLIRYCTVHSIPYFVIHTNQHYSENMDAVFFQELGIPTPNYNLGVGSGSHCQQTAKMLVGIEEILVQEKPSVVVVQGDTNSVLSGCIAAVKLGIHVAHVEAGLRSYDRSMPEEINRIMVDSISHFHFCPTDKQRQILEKEGVAKERIFVTGNTQIDVVREVSGRINGECLGKYGLRNKEYILLTMHRPSNVDHPEVLKTQLENITHVSNRSGMKVFFPSHPRTVSNLNRFNIDIPECIRLTDPVGYFDMIGLQNHARMVMTDSGGIQEEACALRIPTLTLRDNTERPETVEVGANKLVGSNLIDMIEAFEHFFAMKEYTWECPIGDGHAYKKIMPVLSSI